MATISQSEWQVMRVIWTKEETTSAEIIAILADKQGWNASTIKTLIGRLVDKGFLTSRRQGRSYLYRSLISENQALEDQVQALFSRICVRKHHDLLLGLLDRTPMTSQDISRLEDLLVAKKSQVVQEVICDCLPGQCNCHNHLEVKKDD